MGIQDSEFLEISEISKSKSENFDPRQIMLHMEDNASFWPEDCAQDIATWGPVNWRGRATELLPTQCDQSEITWSWHHSVLTAVATWEGWTAASPIAMATQTEKQEEHGSHCPWPWGKTLQWTWDLRKQRVIARAQANLSLAALEDSLLQRKPELQWFRKRRVHPGLWESCGRPGSELSRPPFVSLASKAWLWSKHWNSPVGTRGLPQGQGCHHEAQAGDSLATLPFFSKGYNISGMKAFLETSVPSRALLLKDPCLPNNWFSEGKRWYLHLHCDM
jgi:hypothetical protein